MARKSLQDRFAAKVKRSPGCWLWTAACTAGGYGVMKVDGKLRYAHRLAHEMHIGPIAPQVLVDHICSNRACVRPDHLRTATPKQNAEHLVAARANNTSGYRGVTWHESARAWVAQIGHEGTNYYLGCYATAEEAAAVARQKRLELFTRNDLDRLGDTTKTRSIR